MNAKFILSKKEVVVILLALFFLLVILCAVSHGSSEQAKSIICKSNLHNYGRAGIMYASDNDGSLPYPWTTLYSQMVFPGEASRFCRWHNADYDLTKHPEYAGVLWPYIGQKGVGLCPVFERLALQMEHGYISHAEPIPIVPQYGYTMNAFLGGENIMSGRQYFVEKISQVAHPATVFMFAEENLWINQWAMNALNDTALISQWDNNNPDATLFLDAFATFHKAKNADMNDGVSNAVMVDGHVQQVEAKDTHKLAWPF